VPYPRRAFVLAPGVGEPKRRRPYASSMHYEWAPVLQKEGWVAGTGFGDFAPAPPGSSALVHVSIGSFSKQAAKGGCRSIPLHRSRPLSRRSGCFPALPYPPLSPVSFYCGRIRGASLHGVLKGSHSTLGESGPGAVRRLVCC